MGGRVGGDGSRIAPAVGKRLVGTGGLGRTLGRALGRTLGSTGYDRATRRRRDSGLES